MLKRILGIGLTGILICGSFTGCGNAIMDLSEEDQQKVGEYAAIVMLKYDANHRSRLVDLTDYGYDSYGMEPAAETDDIEPEDEVTEEEAEDITEPETDNADDNADAVPEDSTDVPVIDSTDEDVVVTQTPEEFLGLTDGVSLIYRGYSWTTSYPEDSSDSVFSMDATSGNKFLLVHYSINNNSGTDQTLDFYTTGYVFKASVNQTVTKTALTTMLLDDMSTFMGTIKNGFSEDVVLVFELPEDTGEMLDSLVLTFKTKQDSLKVNLEGSN